MKALTGPNLLQVWEWGEQRHPLDRAMALLTFACPEKTWEELVALNIGRRDAFLFQLRKLTFGPELNGFAHCAECDERLEFNLDIAEICPPEATSPVALEHIFATETDQIHFRLPDSQDLAALVAHREVQMARQALMGRCVLAVEQGGQTVPLTALSESTISDLADYMSHCDPLAEINLDLQCPACKHQWSVLLDIVSFFWAEIGVQAKRLLHEIGILAQFYGWREVDILAMSTKRRQLYLEMATS